MARLKKLIWSNLISLRKQIYIPQRGEKGIYESHQLKDKTTSVQHSQNEMQDPHTLLGPDLLLSYALYHHLCYRRIGNRYEP